MDYVIVSDVDFQFDCVVQSAVYSMPCRIVDILA